MTKKLICGLIALLPFAAMAQVGGNFTIKGKVGKLNSPAQAYLFYQLGANKVVDSAAITNGSFELSGSVLSPVNAGLVIDHQGIGMARLATQSSASAPPDALSFYLDKGNMNITTTTDSVKKADITGSALNDDNKHLMAQLDGVKDRVQKLYAEAQAAPAAQQQSVEFRSAMQRRFKLLQGEQENTLRTFIKSHPDSYLSLLALSSLGGPSADPAVLEPLYNSLSASLKESEQAKQLYSSIQTLKNTAVGVMAPDFTQNDINGTPVKLSSFRGKYVLLDFWASWCGPCRQENPNVVKAYNKYKTRKFTVVGISLDRPGAKQDWINAIKADGLSWTQLSDLKYWDNDAAALYFVRSIPQNFLIDPNGKIVAKDLRGEDLENKLAELLGK
jgi:peroxiredoxin